MRWEPVSLDEEDRPEAAASVSNPLYVDVGSSKVMKTAIKAFSLHFLILLLLLVCVSALPGRRRHE